MRILILSQVYPPEYAPAGVMVDELCDDLRARGEEVQVVTGFPHHPHGRVYPGYKKRLFLRDPDWDGEVLRTWHLTSERKDIPTRTAVLVSQALGNLVGALTVKRPDIVIVYGPPLLGPSCAALVSRFHRAKFVNVIFDIYPDIAIETGNITNPAIIAGARLAEHLQHVAAHRTVVLSEGFRRTLLEKGVPDERLEVIPLWLDPDEIRPMDRDNPWRREQGIPTDKFVVLYAGTIGLVSGAAIVADVAHMLRDRPEILFLFNGEGAARPELERKAAELGLENIRFLPFQPRERLPEVQATADVGLVTLSPGRGRTSVPSKVLGYMAGGRPVLASVDADSDTGREVGDNGLGMVVPPADARALADGVLKLADDAELRRRLGRAGRERLERAYARDAVLARYHRMLQRVL